MEAASELVGMESWESLKDPESGDYLGLPDEPPTEREYSPTDFEMVIEDMRKGKPHFWPQKGKSAIIIGRKNYFRGQEKGLKNLYLIESGETKDIAYIFIFNDRYPVVHAKRIDEGIYLNGKKVENIDIIDSESELLVGKRKFKIRHKYQI